MPRGPRRSEQTRTICLMLLDSGMSPEQIGKIHKVHKQTIQKWARRRAMSARKASGDNDLEK